MRQRTSGRALVVWLLLDRPPEDGGRWQQDLAAQDWSNGIIAALAHGLARNPADRYDGASAWFAAIRDAAVPTAPILLPPTTILSRRPRAEPERRPRRRRMVLAFALLLATAFGAASALTLERRLDANPQQTVEVLDDGQTRNQASSDDRAVTITGPTEVLVGDPVTFEADTTGVKNSFWVAPNGDTHRNVTTLEVTARSSGRATVTPVGIDELGRTLQVAHPFQAVES